MLDHRKHIITHGLFFNPRRTRDLESVFYLHTRTINHDDVQEL
jgi:hypothetical protein